MLISYTHSHTHSYILIHILIYILIHIYSFIYSFMYTFTYSFHIFIHIFNHVLISYTHLCIHSRTHFKYSFTYSIMCSFHILIYVYIHVLIHIFNHVLISYTHLCIHSRTNFIYSFTYSIMCSFHILIHMSLSLNESILLRNLNHSNRIIQTKVMAFSCQLFNLPITLGTIYITHFFLGFNLIFDTRNLYSFKYKVLRVLIQLESPNSEHRNSRYVRNNSDYSMIKLMQKLACTWPHFETFFGPLRVKIRRYIFL